MDAIHKIAVDIVKLPGGHNTFCIAYVGWYNDYAIYGDKAIFKSALSV